MAEQLPHRSPEYGPLTPGELIPEIEAPEAQVLATLTQIAQIEPSGKLLRWSLDLAYLYPRNWREQLDMQAGSPQASLTKALHAAGNVRRYKFGDRIAAMNPRLDGTLQLSAETQAALETSPHFKSYRERRSHYGLNTYDLRRKAGMHSAFFAGLAIFAAEASSDRTLPQNIVE